MFDFEVKIIDRYTAPQRTVYTTPNLQVIFYARGLLFYSHPGFELSRPGAGLHIIPAGTQVNFEFGQDRENWVIEIDSKAVRQSNQPEEIELLNDGAWTRFTALVPVPREHISGWQGEFMRMRDAFRDPHPRNRLRIEAGVLNVIRYMLDRQPDTLGETPAMHLKRLINDDIRCAHNLDELSSECGYSSDHLRKLFVKEYGLTPQKYRMRHRMATAVSLLSNSTLNVKEIASEIGFPHLSHFSTMFRDTYDITPSDAIRQYRAGKHTF
jgi:AraC-like DNA-binding protein